jgi:zinc protease
MSRSRPPVDRRVPPPPGEIRPFHFPRFLRTRLTSGLEVLAARLSSLPLVSFEVVAPAGGQFDPADKAGLAALTASLLDEGTARRSAMELAIDAERLGGYLSSGADWDVGYVATGLLANYREAGLDLLQEVLLSPTFPPEEIERLGSQRLAEIVRRNQDPSSLADDRLYRVIYQGTPYANPLSGDEESIPRLDRESILAFYRSHYGLAGSQLIAVGDFDPEELLREAERRLGGSPGSAGAPPANPEIRPVPLAGTSVHIVDRSGAAQTELRLGHAGIPRNHPDYLPMVVLNTLLGGKFTSRINLNLRERHGFTYGASSRITPRLGPGPFVVNAAVETESAGAAAREVLSELRRIREALVEPEEIEETLSYIVGVFPYTLQTVGDLAKRLETIAVFGLPDDYYDRYPERVMAVTREKLLEVAQRHLDPERMAIVAVGPVGELDSQFEGLGPVTVGTPEVEPEVARAGSSAG